MTHFFGDDFQGVWFEPSLTRAETRQWIESYLQKQLKDPSGKLEVEADGPHWIGSKSIYLSYSHTRGAAILVYSETTALGVDAEPLDREMEPSALKIADRYFHANELKELSSYPEDSGILKLRFLELWVRKEAFGKLTRKGLKDSIHVDVDALNEASFIQAPKTPAGYLAVIAVGA